MLSVVRPYLGNGYIVRKRLLVVAIFRRPIFRKRLSVVRPYLENVISSEAIFRKRLSVVRPYLGKGYQ